MRFIAAGLGSFGKSWAEIVRDGVSTDERERIKALNWEVKELRCANEILNLATAFFAQAELDRRFKS